MTITVLPGHPDIPIVIDVPHSGRDYPDDFDYILDDIDMKKAEDRYVDLLVSKANELGITVIIANFPRTYIDPNRPEDDIDPDIVEEYYPMNKPRSEHSKRGIGLIRRLVKGKDLYKRKLTKEEIDRRIETCYRPYHEALSKAIEEKHDKFGKVWHLNIHSMPNDAAPPISSATPLNIFTKKACFEIGDQEGKTCSANFSEFIYRNLNKKDYSVASNVYYKGVEIVQRYGNPEKGYNSMQLEINKSLYLNERTQEKNKDFDKIENVMMSLCEDLVQWCQTQL